MPEAQSKTLREPQNVPAQTVSWPDDPVYFGPIKTAKTNTTGEKIAQQQSSHFLQLCFHFCKYKYMKIKYNHKYIDKHSLTAIIAETSNIFVNNNIRTLKSREFSSKMFWIFELASRISVYRFSLVKDSIWTLELKPWS